MNFFDKAKRKIKKDALQLYYSLKMGIVIDEVMEVGEIETSEPVLKEERDQLIQKHYTPVFEQLGLSPVRNNVWLSEANPDGVRKMIKYSTTRAGGTICWGVCLTFLPVPSGKRLIYERTNSNSGLHLFESATELMKDYDPEDDSYSEVVKGGIRHEKHRFEKDLVRVINEELPAITRWFDQAETLDGLIEVANDQINEFWGSHFPSQQYVQAFLYAKKGDKPKAIEYFNQYISTDETYAPHLDKISTKLKEL